MTLPPGFLEDLRARASLADLVGRKVTWDRRKSNPSRGDWWAPCPFHEEKSASFHVLDRQGYYKCFGCGAAGDAISFLRELENMSFMDAVATLAAQVGVDMPARDPRAAAQEDRRKSLTDVMEICVAWHRLQMQTAKAARAREYLIGRGLTGAAAKRFEIGFAPDDRAALQEHLAAKGVPLEDMIACGVLARSDDGRVYPRFRDRIMFPIRDGRGRCISFGGRAMDPNARAKYLNGPETTLFDKGRNLYNSAMARAAAGKAGRLIVAEGYMDVIALAEAGFAGAVAPLGTAITEAQIQLMWRIAPEPVIALDGDGAGLRAAYRLIDLALPHVGPGRSLRFALMPDGLDPDDLVRQRGPEAMEAALGAALPLDEMLWRREIDGKTFDAPERRAALDVALLDAAARIADVRLRGHYLDALTARRNALFGATGRLVAEPPPPAAGFGRDAPWDRDGGAGSDRAGGAGYDRGGSAGYDRAGGAGYDRGPDQENEYGSDFAPDFSPDFSPDFGGGFAPDRVPDRGSDFGAGAGLGSGRGQAPRRRAAFVAGRGGTWVAGRGYVPPPEGPSDLTRASVLARLGADPRQSGRAGARALAPSLSMGARDAARMREGAILAGALAHPAAAALVEDALAGAPFVNEDLARVRDAVLDALAQGQPDPSFAAFRVQVDASLGADAWQAAGAPAAVALTRALAPGAPGDVAAAALAEVLDRHCAILSALEETEDAARSLLEADAGEDITHRLAAALRARDFAAGAGGAGGATARGGDDAAEDADASRRLRGFSIPTRSGRKV
jgi:DNA primase